MKLQDTETHVECQMMNSLPQRCHS